MTTRNEPSPQDGVATVALVLVLVPLMLVIGSYLQTMSERNQRLSLEVREEQALLAAESGIDYALNEARRGTLTAGSGAAFPFAGTLPGGSTFEVLCVYLGGDGVDNDGDGDADEEDEDVFQVVSQGDLQGSRRRIAAYLGFSTFLPDLEGAVTVTNPDIRITIGGSGRTHGDNHALSGGLVGSGDTYGIAITPPGDEDDLDDELSSSEEANVTGLGGTPSLGEADPIDVQQIVDFARNSASVVITNTNVSSASIGSAATPVIAYREGDIRIQGNTTGYGLLVVNGSLRIGGTFRWDGVIVCTGTFECGTGTAQIYGGLVQGPESADLILRGTIDMRYSSAGVALASGLTGRYVAFNGWQEISTND